MIAERTFWGGEGQKLGEDERQQDGGPQQSEKSQTDG